METRLNEVDREWEIENSREDWFSRRFEKPEVFKDTKDLGVTDDQEVF